MLAGQLQALFGPINTLLLCVKSVKLRALAVASESRARLLPDVPTIAEEGYPTYKSAIWVSLVASAGTPSDIVQQIWIKTQRALGDLTVIETLSQQGIEAKASTPEEPRALAASELRLWTDLIKSAEIVVHTTLTAIWHPHTPYFERERSGRPCLTTYREPSRWWHRLLRQLTKGARDHFRD